MTPSPATAARTAASRSWSSSSPPRWARSCCSSSTGPILARCGCTTPRNERIDTDLVLQRALGLVQRDLAGLMVPAGDGDTARRHVLGAISGHASQLADAGVLRCAGEPRSLHHFRGGGRMEPVFRGAGRRLLSGAGDGWQQHQEPRPRRDAKSPPGRSSRPRTSRPCSPESRMPNSTITTATSGPIRGIPRSPPRCRWRSDSV